MNGLIAVENNINNYCGFDRSTSYWNNIISPYYTNFPIVDDLFVPISSINEVIDFYSNFIESKSKLICFSLNEIHIDDFNFIGYDCGYLFDVKDDFYLGFSCIANEVIRMDNKLCNLYRNYLNNFMLFPSIEKAKEYKLDRDLSFFQNEINMERAFENFSILYIYISIAVHPAMVFRSRHTVARRRKDYGSSGVVCRRCCQVKISPHADFRLFCSDNQHDRRAGDSGCYQKIAIFATGTNDSNDNVEVSSDSCVNCPLISHCGSPRSCSAAPPVGGDGSRS